MAMLEADCTMDEILLKDKLLRGGDHICCPAYNSAFSIHNTCCTREGPVHQSASVLMNRVKQYSGQYNVLLLRMYSLYCEGENRCHRFGLKFSQLSRLSKKKTALSV